MPRGLLDMPEDVMSKIMEDIGIKAIVTLRKVCHDVRNFIDDVKPDANLEEVWVNGWDTSDICLRYKFSGEDYFTEYKKHEEGSLVMNINRGNQILLKNDDFLTVCMKDLEIVLGHQKSVLKHFTLIGRCGNNMDVRVMEDLQRILKSRDHPLKVEKLTVEYMDQNQIISILPFLDSKTLNTLEVGFNEKQTEVDQLIKLDQWKNIKHIVFKMPIDYKYIQHFTHFSTADVSFKSEDFPDLVLLKNLFLQSYGFKVIKVRPCNFIQNDVQQSTNSLGGPFLYINNGISWYCRIPDTNQILEISVINKDFWGIAKCITLSRIEENSVPQEAVIQN